MCQSKLNLLISLGCLLAVTLACNYSFTTANLSSLKLGKDKSANTETSNFDSSSTIYAVAQISNTSDKHKATCRVLFEDVEGQKSGELVPGSETTLDVPGAAEATFTLTPPASGWQGGRYKIEVTMKNEDGKQIDQKSATFTVTGASKPAVTENKSSAISATPASGVRLAQFVLSSNMESEPEEMQAVFAPEDTIYVFYTLENASRTANVYCQLFTENAEGFAPDTMLRALSYSNPTSTDFAERFDLDPKKEADGQTIWASGTYRLELSYTPDGQSSPQILKTQKLTVR